jgi:hypothetical protein
MNAEKPATGISKLADYPKAKCYRVDCECTTPDHAVDTWIEVERAFDDCEDISVRFYVNTYSHPLANGFWQRLKNACKILVGVDQQQHEILLKQQAAKNWISSVEKAIAEFSHDQNKNKDS